LLAAQAKTMRLQWRFAVMLASAAALSGTLTAQAQKRTSGPASVALLDECQRRDYTQFQSDLAKFQDFDRILIEAKAATSTWPPDLASACLLEVAAVAFHAELFPKNPGTPYPGHPPRSYSGGALGAASRRDFLPLLNLSATLAKKTPPDSAYGRAWARAAVALLEGGDEVSPQEPASSVGEALGSFLESERDRLDEPTIRMAQGMIQEAIVATSVSYNLPTVQGNRVAPDGVAIGSQSPAIRGAFDEALKQGLSAFAAAQAFPDARAEAAVRWGALALARRAPGDVTEALARFQVARQSTTDADILYLSWFFEGRALQALGRPEDAVLAFQHAVELKPQGGAAQLEWAAQSFLAGDTTTADRLTQSILNAPIDADDPWMWFHVGDYRHWAQRERDLRAAVR
jgi:hypothetical protein